MFQNMLSFRTAGFILSLILTLVAYFVIIHPEFFYLDAKMAVFTILMLALLGSVVQYVFFLHIWDDHEPVWNLSFFISTVMLVLVIVFFSMWIMAQLDYNMMP
ncbi:MAG: cytochrome C oxidase subunit IV family protein [Parachlamydiaceae bacterium]|nr:cytochrome C oxidase subunit IV family protein [Parachlamydiaceae bacterium]